MGCVNLHLTPVGMESGFYGFKTLKLKQMTNRDLAEKIYEDLNKRGADLGNASIGIIRKTLDDNGVKNCSIPDVSNNEVVCCGNCHLPLDNIEIVPKVQIADKKYNP